MKPEVITLGHKIFVCGFTILSPFVAALLFGKNHYSSKEILQVYPPFGDCSNL